jgi:hypothetical protein
MNALIFRISFSLKPQHFQGLLVSFARTNITPQLFLMDIVKCQPVLNAVSAVIGGRQTFRMVCMALQMDKGRHVEMAIAARVAGVSK